MKRLLLTFIAVLLGTGSIVFSADILPPPWRGEEGSTVQMWGFSTSVTEPDPDFSDNIYGDPELGVVPGPGDGWIDVLGQRQGIWALSGKIYVHIPNFPVLREYKEIWLQLVWKSEDRSPLPYIPDEPDVGIHTNPLYEYYGVSRSDTVDFAGDGWVHSIFHIDIWPNPIEEWIGIEGDILVDYLAIDTICVPEPGTALLIGAGALIGFVRRRRTA